MSRQTDGIDNKHPTHFTEQTIDEHVRVRVRVHACHLQHGGQDEFGKADGVGVDVEVLQQQLVQLVDQAIL